MGRSSYPERCQKRYKDDINTVLDVENTLMMNEDQVVREERAMECVKTLADEIDPALSVTVDYSSKHRDGRLPVLDLRVWVNKNIEGINKVLHTHYMKDVASRGTIHYRSSHSMQMKKNVLVNEIGRILGNCSEEISWEEATENVSYLMRRMQFSEYPVTFRQEVLAKAFKKYDLKNNNGGSSRGGQPENIRGDKHQWYSRGGQYESVMFVEATPGSEMMRRVQNVVRRLKMKIKVVERAGETIKGLLQRSNPFGVQDCG